MQESEAVSQSLLTLAISALGPVYTVLLPLSAFVCFVLVLTVVLRGKGPMAAAALVLLVHVPLLIGIFAAIQGAMASYRVIAMSEVAPRPSDLAIGISTALIAPLVALVLTVPSYVTAVVGSFIRSLVEKNRSA